MRLIEFIYDWLAHETVYDNGDIMQRWEGIVAVLFFIAVLLLSGVDPNWK